MFQKFPLALKVLVFCCSNLLAFSIAIWAFRQCASSNSWLVQVAFLFILTWSLILGAFLFYQTFKYFRLPQLYYHQLPFENTAFFARMGVQHFRKILINSFFRHLNPRVYIRERSRAEYLRFIEETKQSETSHLLSGFATCIFQLLFLYQADLFPFWVLGSFNLIFNLYPMLLQRSNRFQFLVKLDKFS